MTRRQISSLSTFLVLVLVLVACPGRVDCEQPAAVVSLDPPVQPKDGISSSSSAIIDRSDATATAGRRELSWWGVALFFSAQCPPGILGKHCRRRDRSHGGHGGGGGSGSGNGGGSDGGGSDGGSNGGGSGSGSGGGGGSSGGSGGSGSGGNARTNASQDPSNTSPGSKTFWAMLAAAVAVTAATAAIILGSRRSTRETPHPLRGTLARRMRMFGGLSRNIDVSPGDAETEMHVVAPSESRQSTTDYRTLV